LLSYDREQVVAPDEDYWWDNRERQPHGGVVCQYTLRGSMLVRDAQGDHEVPVGHAALFCFPSESAYGRPSAWTTGYRCAFVTLLGAGLYQHWQALIALGGPVVAAGSDLPQAMQRVMAARASGDPLVLASAVQQFVHDLFARVRQRRLSKLGPAEQAIERMLAMPAHPWSLKDLAREFGCSREHLARRFRERTGETPAAWLRTRRLALALDLLRDTDLPISEVARQSGLSSSHTLARLVREAVGCAPTAARERLRG